MLKQAGKVILSVVDFVDVVLPGLFNSLWVQKQLSFVKKNPIEKTREDD